MTGLLPDAQNISISRSSSLPTEGQIKRLGHLLVVMPESPGEDLWHQLPFGDVLAALAWRRRAENKAPLSTHFPAAGRAAVTIGFVARGGDSFTMHTAVRKIVAPVLSDDAETVGVVVLGWDKETTVRLQSAAVSALLVGAFRMPSEKKKQDRKPRLRRLRIFAPDKGLDTKRLLAEAEGNNLARWLTALPPNRLDAKNYREAADKLARQEGWKIRFLDERALKRKGAGAFLAVSQGNAARDAGIIHIRYRPPKVSGRPALALVGKGICFDTGGNNLKPFKSMLDMHQDMEGSAVALGTLLALSRLGYRHPVDCWLAVTENRIGPSAYKSRDVVTASNGTSIEVIHTDAEGRMALADALALACAEAPSAVIDFATLTGTCVYAVSSRYSGVFSNRIDLYPLLKAAGRATGERVWGFPMDEDFDESIDSKVADVAQCASDSDADHILAARFLGRFVDNDIPWVHMDLSAGSHKGGLGLIPTPVTGFGVRFTLGLLLDRDFPKCAGGRKA
jgi:leucyl aminopeptidase